MLRFTARDAPATQAVADRDPDIQRALLAHMRLTAATKLQSGCRGKIARNRVKEERVRIAALPPPEVQVEAAVRIQAVGRGHVTRQQLEDGKTTEMACQVRLCSAAQCHGTSLELAAALLRATLPWKCRTLTDPPVNRTDGRGHHLRAD